jgi:hypothetical protein
MCLASTSPLIIPFGFLYTTVKHVADSYCLISGIMKVSSRLENRPFYLTVANILIFGKQRNRFEEKIKCSSYVCLFSRKDSNLKHFRCHARSSHDIHLPTFVS